MGADLHIMSVREWLKQTGIAEDTARQRCKVRLPDKKWSLNLMLTASEIEILSAGRAKSTTPKTGVMKSEKSEPKLKVEAKKEDSKQPKTGEEKLVLTLSIFITVVSVFLTITGLFVFASWAGAMLGIMFSLFLFSAVWVARNRMKGATSEQALSTVWKLETGAAGLHFFTFYRLLQIDDIYFKAGACLFLSGFVAYLSYSAVLTVRNYNAEI